MYQQTFDEYLKKEYIYEVNNKKTKWLLPHFPGINLERSTTKVQTVFNASVKKMD